MTTEPNTAQSIVDGQLAELQITSAEVTATDYKEAHALKIAALATEADALPDITDKATLQANQDFLTKATRARTGIDKWRKAWKEPWKKIADQVDTYLGTNRESGLQAKIAAIEDRVEAKKKAYLDEQAKAHREAERLLEERYTGRVAKLLEAGMSIEANGNLTIRDGEQTLSALPRDIRFATDEQMAAVLAKVEVIRAAQVEREAAALQAKEAEERERQEEADWLAQQKREQDAAAAKLKEEREALDREREEMADHRAEARGADLVVLGATAHGYGPAAMRYEIGDVIVGHGELRHMDAETWTATRERVRDAKVKAIEEQKERERQNWTQAGRAQTLHELGASEKSDGGWVIGDEVGTRPHVSIQQLRTMTSDEWAPVLARFKEAAQNAKLFAASALSGKGTHAAFEAIRQAAEAREQAAVNMAMAASSGISEGDPLVDETMDFLADKDRLKALSDAIQGEGSAVDGAQPVDEPEPGSFYLTEAAVKLMEEQHDIHEAINDLSIFADPKNWGEDEFGARTFIGNHAAFPAMEPWELVARALKVLAIEKA